MTQAETSSTIERLQRELEIKRMELELLNEKARLDAQVAAARPETQKQVAEGLPKPDLVPEPEPKKITRGQRLRDMKTKVPYTFSEDAARARRKTTAPPPVAERVPPPVPVKMVPRKPTRTPSEAILDVLTAKTLPVDQIAKAVRIPTEQVRGMVKDLYKRGDLVNVGSSAYPLWTARPPENSQPKVYHQFIGRLIKERPMKFNEIVRIIRQPETVVAGYVSDVRRLFQDIKLRKYGRTNEYFLVGPEWVDGTMPAKKTSSGADVKHGSTWAAEASADSDSESDSDDDDGEPVESDAFDDDEDMV